jgi:hypothetical protein
VKHFLLVGVSIVALGPSDARAEDKPPAPAQERVQLAKRIYQERILFGLNRRIAPPQPAVDLPEDPLLNEAMAEDLYRWSVRWLEAECDAAANRAGRVAAAQAHLDRMRTVESGKMARKELANHPLVKELDQKRIPVDMGVEELRAVIDQYGDATRRYPEVARYLRLEAEARLAKEKAGR